MKGLLCQIYEGKGTGNCSMDGVSNRFKQVILTGAGVPEIFEPSEDAPEVQLIVNGNNGHYFVDRRDNEIKRMKAEPVEVGSRWAMFGGSFIYSSDSRFPANSPIHLFDRMDG